MGWAVAAGATVGLGLLLILRGLRPSRPSLAQALAAFRSGSTFEPILHVARVDNAAGEWQRQVDRLARWVSRVLPRSAGSPQVKCDLAVLGRTVEEHVAQKLGYSIVGFMLPWVAALVGTATHRPLPLWIPAGASIALGAALFLVVGDASVHGESDRRRQEFRQALAVYIDLVSIALGGGSKIESALIDAAAIGRGWAFAQLRQALRVVSYSRETTWQALARLGAELDIPELREIAATIGVAGTEGARIRNSLAARAEAMRLQRLAEDDSLIRKATEVMSFPVVLLAFTFMAFLTYPAIVPLIGGLPK